MRVNEVIRKQQAETIDKMRTEMREMKQIIRIPRMHFKYLEKMEYDEMIEKMHEIEACQKERKTDLNEVKKQVFKHRKKLSHSSAAGHQLKPGTSGPTILHMKAMSDTSHSFFNSPVQLPHAPSA